MTAHNALDELEPALVWQRFAELTRIARPSKHEDEARAHVLRWTAARGLAAHTDAGGNVVVRIPPSSGREGAPVVVLQAHLDMVCERDADSPYDPREGRIGVVVDGDWVAAEGTTLGADNGVGVAAALAVVEDAAIEHGPLELLFTVSEEQSLEGAKALDPSLVTGRLLVNLDGTSDDSLTVGCAGSAHTSLHLPFPTEPVPEDHVALELTLAGARGGHSGGDIARGRVNAIKALGRLLAVACESTPLRMAGFSGGASRNAIPRSARARIVVDPGAETSVRDAAHRELEAVRGRFAATETQLALSIERTHTGTAATLATTTRAIDVVSAIPTGVIALNQEVPGAVETSTSLTVTTTENGTLTLASMSRSSNAAALDDVVASLEAIGRLADAAIEVRRSYPPWSPDLGSHLLETAQTTFERLFDGRPGLDVVHGGLECAVLGEKLPGVEMLSIGPAIVGMHAPGERVGISSTQRFYRLLGALLDDLSS